MSSKLFPPKPFHRFALAFSFLYMLSFVSVPFLFWSKLVLERSLPLPLLGEEYATALCLLGPVFWSAVLIWVLRSLRLTRIWTAEWLVLAFGSPAFYVLLARDLLNGDFFVFQKVIAFILLLLSIRIVFYSHSERVATQPKGWKLGVLFHKLTYFGSWAFLNVFAMSPMLSRFLAFGTSLELPAGVLDFGYSQVVYGPLFTTLQGLVFGFFVILRISLLPMESARSRWLLCLVIALPVVYLFHIWYAYYLLNPKVLLLLALLVAPTLPATRVLLLSARTFFTSLLAPSARNG